MIDLISNELARGAVAFLFQIYDNNFPAISRIVRAQADGDIDTIIEDLEDIHKTLSNVINKLKELKNENSKS